MALKAAMLQVRADESRCAAAAGSELSSRWFRPGFYEETALVDEKGRARLEAEFLRWTLSDGAGAVLVEPRPRAAGISLRIDWVDLISYADRFAACMWAGAPKDRRFDLKDSWSFSGPLGAWKEGAIALQQDFELLKPIIRAWVARYLELVEGGRIDPSTVDHVLCHYSAESLRVEIVTLLEAAGAMIPQERWFSNLKTKGNTGSAAIFVLLEEMRRVRPVRAGDRILCVVPESGRAMIGFAMLTAVEGEGE
jgi:3-oxoacyl-[acyl-carrier-protein] synthase-3